MQGLSVFLSREGCVEKEDNVIKCFKSHCSVHRLKYGVADEMVAADLLGCIVEFHQSPTPETHNGPV